MASYAVIIDRDAAADIQSIRNFIAERRSLEFANAFAGRIVAYCESLGALPHRGTKRDEVWPGLRTVAWRRAITVAFEVSDETKRVTVLGVFYRGRDVLKALEARRN